MKTLQHKLTYLTISLGILGGVFAFVPATASALDTPSPTTEDAVVNSPSSPTDEDTLDTAPSPDATPSTPDAARRAAPVTVVTPKQQLCEGSNGKWDNATKKCDIKSGKNLGDFIQTIVNVLLFVIGAVSVIMIVIGGLKYTTSNGDSTAVTSAKNTILYSVIGLVVALMAYAIVNWVVGVF